MNSIANAKSCAIQRRPTRMLKEFLRDDDSSSNSCSSSDPNRQPPPPPLPRSRSRSRAAVSSFQKLLTSAVKSIHRISPSASASASPPTTLPRSFSKRFLTKFRRSKKSRSGSGEGKIIKVKDILRWRSFRDEEKPRRSDSPETSASIALTTATTSGSSEESSWEDSEFSFTAEELPQLRGKGEKVWNNDVDVVDGGDPVRETTGAMDVPELGPEEEPEDNIVSEEEKEQHSPVSVLNSPFRDEVSDEEITSSFDQSLANVERTKQRLLQSIQWLESLAGVDEQSSQNDDSETEDQAEEEKGEENITDENASKAKSRDYMFKVLSRLTREGQGVKSKDCIKDMEAKGQWSKFGEEREEVGEELEGCLLHDLVEEVFVDLFG